jgi:hypothetical protein
MDPLIIRTSDRGIFKRCRQQWDWTSKIRQDLEPAFPPQPLEFGTAIHRGMEAYYDPEMWPHRGSAVHLASMKSAFVAEATKQRKAYEAAVASGLDPERAEVQLGLGMLEHYANWAPNQDVKWTPIKTEIEFEVRIPFVYKGFQYIVYQGRIDLLVQDTEGFYWIVDHKTAGQFGATQWFDLDEQGGSYCWALSLELGLPIKGVIYNRLLKDVPSPPDQLKKPREGRNFSVNKQMRCTAELYEKTLLAAGEPLYRYLDHIDFLQQRGNVFFQRHPVVWSRRAQEIQRDKIVLEAQDMLNEPRIYNNPGPFTCMGCAWMGPCLAKRDGADYELILSTMSRKRTNDGPEGLGGTLEEDDRWSGDRARL